MLFLELTSEKSQASVRSLSKGEVCHSCCSSPHLPHLRGKADELDVAYIHQIYVRCFLPSSICFGVLLGNKARPTGLSLPGFFVFLLLFTSQTLAETAVCPAPKTLWSAPTAPVTRLQVSSSNLPPCSPSSQDGRWPSCRDVGNAACPGELQDEQSH